MTLLGALVVLLHLRRRNLDFLHTYIHTYILQATPAYRWVAAFAPVKESPILFMPKLDAAR